MATTFDKTVGKQVSIAINSCLRPLCSVDGESFTTIEAIGSVEKGLDPVQNKIVTENGTQCGFVEAKIRKRKLGSNQTLFEKQTVSALQDG